MRPLASSLFPSAARPRRSRLRTAACLALVVALPALGGGCQLYRSLGNGQRMDSSSARPHHEPSRKARDIQAEVITDAAGAVAGVRIVRSSGSAGPDDYLIESIKANWPGGPSMKTLVELTYSAADGFSEPKVLSAAPLP